MRHRGPSKVKSILFLEFQRTYPGIDVLSNSDDKNLLLKAELSQPLCTVLQIALVDLLATWSIIPSAVVGHSSDELAAAYAAGVLSAKDAIVTAFYRGQVCKTAKKTGGMAAVGLGKEDVSPYLASGVRIACENSGSSVTLSGDLEVLEKVMSKIKEARPDILVRKLQVEMAYHSRKPFLFDIILTLAKKHRSHDSCWRRIP